MSYSRWGGRGSGNWYTFWMYQDKETENRDTALFDICTVAMFSAKRLRDDLEGCMAKVREKDPEGDIEELKVYVGEFLSDVDDEYPEGTGDSVNRDVR